MSDIIIVLLRIANFDWHCIWFFGNQGERIYTCLFGFRCSFIYFFFILILSVGNLKQEKAGNMVKVIGTQTKVLKNQYWMCM